MAEEEGEAQKILSDSVVSEVEVVAGTEEAAVVDDNLKSVVVAAAAVVGNSKTAAAVDNSAIAADCENSETAAVSGKGNFPAMLELCSEVPDVKGNCSLEAELGRM